MRERHRFRPTSVDLLEARLVLNGAVRLAPADIRIHAARQPRTSVSRSVVSQVNQAFDSFSALYLQAQGAYLASTPAEATAVFQRFTSQQVGLLAQQLTRIFAHVPGSLDRLTPTARRNTDSDIVLQAFLRARITGAARETSLLFTLNQLIGLRSTAIPGATPAGSGQTTTLYVLSATSAIETARTATLNALGFLSNKSFNNTRR